MPLNIDSQPEPATNEEILAAWGQAVNEDIRDLASGAIVPAGAEPVIHFAWDSAATVGLTFGVKSGVMWDGTTLSVKAPQTTLLTNNATNYVELDRATGVISDNIVGFTSGRLPLFQVTTAGALVTAVLDRRAPYGLDGSSGGGGGGSSGSWNRTAIIATGTTNFVVPAGVRVLYVTCVGGGGGGAGSGAPYNGQGASGGGVIWRQPLGVVPGETCVGVVGAGGAGGAGAGIQGAYGGHTTFTSPSGGAVRAARGVGGGIVTPYSPAGSFAGTEASASYNSAPVNGRYGRFGEALIAAGGWGQGGGSPGAGFYNHSAFAPEGVFLGAGSGPFNADNNTGVGGSGVGGVGGASLGRGTDYGFTGTIGGTGGSGRILIEWQTP